MSEGWVDGMRRLEGGLILLLVMSFAVAPAASAHSASHGDQSQSSSRGQSVSPAIYGREAGVFSAPIGGLSGSERGGNICPTCCGTGACSMFFATMASGPSVTAWLPKVSAAFGRSIHREMPGLRFIPGTRPARLDV